MSQAPPASPPASSAAGIGSVPDIVDVEVVRGAAAAPGAVADLLVEVPHGADRRAHHEVHRRRLRGDLPADLHQFTHVNTDVGAWQYGRRAAEHAVALQPSRTALVLRCLVPRTLIDCNRVADAKDQLQSGGMTAGLAPYVRDPEDQRLLLDVHRRYTAVAGAAYAAVCGGGGLALQPHTYAPVSVDIGQVDDDIVRKLRAAYEPDQIGRWPARPEIDIISRTADGTSLCPEGAEDQARQALEAGGFAVAVNQTYHMHPATLGYAWASRYPGQTFSLEVRRDLLVRAWRPFEEMEVDPAAVEGVAAPLGRLLDGWLAARGH